MKILHLQYGIENKIKYPKKNYIHMFCCLQNDPIYYELKSLNITTNITATIIHHGMDNCDWKFILTSDI